MLKNDDIPAGPTPAPSSPTVSQTPLGAAASSTAAMLPLVGIGSKIKTIAVIGPNADNQHSQMGGYSNSGARVVTVLDAAVVSDLPLPSHLTMTHPYDSSLLGGQ